MTFLLDENFPKSATEILEQFGHDWRDLRGTEDEGADDTFLVEKAGEIGAVILTTDRDFYHTLRHQHPDHSGIIVIALKQPNRAAIVERLEWALTHLKVEDMPGRAFQLRDRTWVARPPLPEPDEA